MKIVSVTMVKNEADIIEFFVRYNLQLLDEMYIIDHLSNDRTLEILKNLKKEGLKINVYKYNSFGYDQGQIFTSLANQIRANHSADFVVFMDADEFIAPVTRKEFEMELSMLPNYSYVVPSNEHMYMGTPTFNALKTNENMKYKLSNSLPHPKVIVNLNIYPNEKILVSEGGHQLNVNGIANYKTGWIKNVYLAHFRYRSREQMLSKMSVGCLSYLIRGVRHSYSGMAFHWFVPFYNFLDTGDLNSFVVPSISESDLALSRATIAPLNFPYTLKYTNSNEVNALNNLIDFFKKYLSYQGDLENRKDLVYLMDNAHKSDYADALLKIGRAGRDYCEAKSLIPFSPSNLEEVL